MTQVDREKLLAALRLVAHMARRSTIPVLECIKIEAADGTIRVTACDLEKQITATCEAAVPEHWGFCVLAKSFMAAIENAPAAVVALSAKDGGLAIKSARYEISFGGFPVEDFPDMASTKDLEPVPVTPKDLARMQAFASGDDVKMHLNGVHIDKGSLVATDGTAIALAPIEHEGITGTIPTTAIGSLKKIFDCNAPRLWLGKTAWRAEAEGVSAFGLLISGAFINWRQIAIGEAQPIASVALDELIQATKACAVGDVESLILSGSDGALQVAAVADGYGRVRAAQHDLTAEILNAFSVRLSEAYLRRVLSALDSERVDISAAGELLVFQSGSFRAILAAQRDAANFLPGLGVAA